MNRRAISDTLTGCCLPTVTLPVNVTVQPVSAKVNKDTVFLFYPNSQTLGNLSTDQGFTANEAEH